jgi:hypothetical protein
MIGQQFVVPKLLNCFVLLSVCTASFYWEPTKNPAKDSEGKDQAASIFVK